MKNSSLVNIALLVSVSVVLLAGCSSNTQRENIALGTVGGAVVGGLAGSLIGQGTGQLVAVGAGAVAGGLIGGSIGASMDSNDKISTYNALNNNGTNRASTWVNNKSGTKYRIKPTSKTFSYEGNSYCRTYRSTAIVSGKKHSVSGIACRQSDGSWRAMNS